MPCTPLLLCALLSQPSDPLKEIDRDSVRAADAARVALVERLAPTVVCIFPKNNRNGGGSGVLIHPDGYGLTNYHVVASVGREGKGGRSDGALYDLEVLGLDPAGDIAMFKLSGGEPFPWAPLADSDQLRVGDETLAMGNPFLLAEDYYPTVTFGIIAGLHRYLAGQGRALIYTDCIEISTSINPGNSGGPLFTMRGELAGINGRIGIEERGRVNVGVGYAISANQVKRFMPALRAGLTTKHATLGATVFERSAGDVRVDQILETSDAYMAGLRLNDRVRALCGAAIHNANQVLNMVGLLPADWPVSMDIERDGKRQTLRFRLESLPLPKMPKPPADMPPDMAKKFSRPLSAPNVEANLREVRRTLALARQALGDADMVERVSQLRITPQKPADAAKEPAVITESRDLGKLLGSDDVKQAEPSAVEAAVRWSLYSLPAKPKRSEWKIIGSDAVGGRICVVVERMLKADRKVTMAFDDETGQLLRVSFKDTLSGRQVHYEYGDFRTVAGLRLPHRRSVFIGTDGAARSTAEVAGIEVITPEAKSPMTP